jgi:hypothetical protein
MATPQRLQYPQDGCNVPGVSGSFASLIAALVAGYAGSKRDFAHDAEIAPSVLSRLLGGGLPPVTDVCLRIAKAGGVSASVVLRAAGHGHTADVIEQLYGPPRVTRPEGTAADRALWRDIQGLDPAARKAIHTLIAFHHAVAPEAARPRRRSGERRRRTVPAQRTA